MGSTARTPCLFFTKGYRAPDVAARKNPKDCPAKPETAAKKKRWQGRVNTPAAAPEEIPKWERNSRNTPPRPPSARRVALTLLLSVLHEKQALDIVWAKVMSPAGAGAKLSLVDRAFCRQLVATVLRRLTEIDGVIDHCLKRPLDSHAYRATNILRLGVAQLLFLRTPSHAAINETVGLAARLTKFKGLINAVLRRLDGEGADLLQKPGGDVINCPDWLRQSWVTAYGEDQAGQIIRACLAEPFLDITLKGDDGDWPEQLEAETLASGSLRRAGGGRIEGLAGYDDGAWWIQDAAAALPVGLLGDLAGQRVLDMCTAPGGKLSQLAAKGAAATGLDNSKERLSLTRRNLRRLGLQADLVATDARQWRPKEKFAAVLLDAPCTATGTIRRHPDIWHLKGPDDVQRVLAVQDQLLDAAANAVAPGGLLVYCTCSLQPEEGEDRVDAFLGRHAGFKIERIVPGEANIESDWINKRGELRTLPSHLGGAEGGLDGFFACRLRAPEA